MINKKLFLGLFLACSVFLLYLSIYQISDKQYAIRIHTIMGQANTGPFVVKEPGLHFKWPLFDKIIYIDKRVQRTELCSTLLSLQNHGVIRINYFINWRIKNPQRYANTVYNTRPAFPKTPSDWPVFLERWSNQFLQRTWTIIPIEKSITKNFDNLQIYLTQKAERMGIEILSCHILNKIPTLDTKKNILQKLCAAHTQRNQESFHKGALCARSIYSQAKVKQSILYAQAEKKTRSIQNEAEVLAMQIYLNAYSKEPKFAAFYQNLQGEGLVIGQNPELATRYQNLRGYNASFAMKMPNTTIFNAQSNAAV